MNWSRKDNYIIYENKKFLILSENASKMLTEMWTHEIGKKFQELLSYVGDVINEIGINLPNFIGFYVTKGIDNSNPVSPHKEGRAIDISIAYIQLGEVISGKRCNEELSFWASVAMAFADKYPNPFNQIICPAGVIDLRWNRQTVIDNFLNNKKLLSDDDLKYVDKLITGHQNHFHINLVK